MRRLLVIAVVMVLAGAARAAAQTAPVPTPGARLYQGLFDGAGTTHDRSALSMTFLEGYDDDLAGEHVGPPPSVISQGGFFNALIADFNYRSRGTRKQFTVTGGTDLRYYPEVHDVVGIGHYAGVGISTPLRRSVTLTASQAVVYTPAYWYRLFAPAAPVAPGEVTPTSDYLLGTPESSLNYDTSVALTMGVGRHDAIAVQSGSRYTNYVSSTSLRNLWDFDIGGTYSHAIGRDSHFTAGYVGRRTTVYGSVAPEHDIVAGFDYLRRLSATRTSTLAASVGAAVMQEPAASGSMAAPRPAYRMVVDAAYGRDFGRSWRANGAYHRGFGVIEGIATPLFSDAMTVAAQGFASRSVDLALLASYTHGDPSLRASETSWFTTYTASARTRVGLNARWAIYLEYVYYYYDFRDIPVPAGVPPTATRNAARAGVTTWVPFARSR